MGNKRKPPRKAGPKRKSPGAGRYKPHKVARIPLALAELMEELAEEEFSNFNTQVRIACRERLIRKGKLPTPQGGSE